MTIPVWKKGLGLQRIDEVRICHDGRQAQKHLLSLKQAYADLFEKNGVELRFAKARSCIYPQLWGDFIPDLSTFDLLFNCGPRARAILFSAARGSGHAKPMDIAKKMS